MKFNFSSITNKEIRPTPEDILQLDGSTQLGSPAQFSLDGRTWWGVGIFPQKPVNADLLTSKLDEADRTNLPLGFQEKSVRHEENINEIKPHRVNRITPDLKLESLSLMHHPSTERDWSKSYPVAPLFFQGIPSDLIKLVTEKAYSLEQIQALLAAYEKHFLASYSVFKRITPFVGIKGFAFETGIAPIVRGVNAFIRREFI